jgi:hypothetical protein
MLDVSKELVVVVADPQRKRRRVGHLTAPHLRSWYRALPQPLESIGLRRRLLATIEEKVVVLIFRACRSGSSRRHPLPRLLVTLAGDEDFTVVVVEAQGE